MLPLGAIGTVALLLGSSVLALPDPMVVRAPPLLVLADTGFVSDSAASLRGSVTDSSGAPVQRATILVDGDAVTTYSRGDGSFGPVLIGAGHHRVTIAAPGFRMLGADFDVVAKAAPKLTVTMIPDGTRLPEVHVAGRHDLSSFEAPRFSGFAQRRANGTGRYLDEGEIAARAYPPLSELLRNMPGIALHPMMSNGMVTEAVVMRAAGGVAGLCMTPLVYLDGSQVMIEKGDAFALDHLVPPQEIAAIEVYPGASSVPPQFNSTVGAACGVIVVWTKDGARQ